MKVETLDIRMIVPDEDQPRKSFDANKLSLLKKSISKHGIMNPLTVEKQANGTFLLVDGERRYRAAVDLKMKEVPVIEIKPQNKADRLIQQFHIQEQHESWTSAEKATAMAKLAEELDLTLESAAQLLNISDRVASNYMSFAKIINKDIFEKHRNLNMDWAERVNGLKNTLRNQLKKTDIEFDRPFEKKFEKAVLNRILNGDIQRPSDVSQLKDAFRKEPTSAIKFMEDESITPKQLFTRTKAKGAEQVRKLGYLSGYVSAAVRSYMQLRDTEIPKGTIVALKEMIDETQKLLNYIQE